MFMQLGEKPVVEFALEQPVTQARTYRKSQVPPSPRHDRRTFLLDGCESLLEEPDARLRAVEEGRITLDDPDVIRRCLGGGITTAHGHSTVLYSSMAEMGPLIERAALTVAALRA